MGLASLGQLKYTLELDKKIITKMKFIEGVGLKNDIGQDMAWSLEVIIYIPNASFTHNIDCCSQN